MIITTCSTIYLRSWPCVSRASSHRKVLKMSLVTSKIVKHSFSAIQSLQATLAVLFRSISRTGAIILSKLSTHLQYSRHRSVDTLCIRAEEESLKSVMYRTWDRWWLLWTQLRVESSLLFCWIDTVASNLLSHPANTNSWSWASRALLVVSLPSFSVSL